MKIGLTIKSNNYGKNQYVVPTEDGWGLRGENNEKLTKKFDKKVDAIDYAKILQKISNQN